MLYYRSKVKLKRMEFVEVLPRAAVIKTGNIDELLMEFRRDPRGRFLISKV